MLLRHRCSTLTASTTLFRSYHPSSLRHVQRRDPPLWHWTGGYRREPHLHWRGGPAPLAWRGGGSGQRCRLHRAHGGVHRSASRRSEEHTSELQSRENLVCRL